ncbi:MAG TPA: tRNA pseudouridine(38-40) synthase TruA [bacterium]|nr:tRNA pseudouridine(38-40) synthase TruA [bacterium]
MPFWKLVLEYDGTEFAGWQVQPSERTVQGELKEALETVLRHPVRVTGAGRTDAGVHALGQVVSLESPEDVAAARRSLNGVLPDDVVVREAVAAPDGFHARYDAVRRHYRYRLHRGATAVHRRFAWEVRPEPDPEAMRAAAVRLTGHRDFASLASGTEPDETTECRLERVEVRERGAFLDVEVTANRFLRKMVRTMVGTLLEVGWGKQPPEWIDEVLAGRDRRLAGPVIPPTGLFLSGVEYPGDDPATEGNP